MTAKLRVYSESHQHHVVLADNYGTTRLTRVTKIEITPEGVSLNLNVDAADCEIELPADMPELLIANQRLRDMLEVAGAELEELRAVKLCARCALADSAELASERPTIDLEDPIGPPIVEHREHA